MTDVITGKNIALKVQLTKDGAPFAIDAGATVTAGFRRNGEKISPEVTCLPTAEDANWPASLVVVEFTGDESAEMSEHIRHGLDRIAARLEVDVDDVGWITPVLNVWRGVL